MIMKTSIKKINNMLNPTLEETFDPQSMIALIPIHCEQKVADIGSGPGWLSIPLAKYLYLGKCISVDIQNEMLKKVKSQAKKYKLGNIETILSEENKIPIDDDSVEGVVFSDILNEAKSLVQKNYLDKKIIHMVVKKFIFDDEEFFEIHNKEII